MANQATDSDLGSDGIDNQIYGESDLGPVVRGHQRTPIVNMIPITILERS